MGVTKKLLSIFTNILTIPFIIALSLFSGVIVATSVIFSNLFGSKKRAWVVLVSLDQTINTVFGGDEDETISSRCYRERSKYKYEVLMKVIDLLFLWAFGEQEHCKNSFLKEVEKANNWVEVAGA